MRPDGREMKSFPAVEHLPEIIAQMRKSPGKTQKKIEWF